MSKYRYIVQTTVLILSIQKHFWLKYGIFLKKGILVAISEDE